MPGRLDVGDGRDQGEDDPLAAGIDLLGELVGGAPLAGVVCRLDVGDVDPLGRERLGALGHLDGERLGHLSLVGALTLTLQLSKHSIKND